MGIHRTHLDLVVRALRRPTGRVLNRHSRRQSEAVPNWQLSHSKVELPNNGKSYVAPHSRASAVSRANGDGGSLRAYSRIPLHLQGKTPGAADAVNDSNTGNMAGPTARTVIIIILICKLNSPGLATLIRIGKLQLHYRAKYLLPNNGCIN